jgi:hypothetical protein
LDALVDYLLLFTLVAILLHSKIKNFLRQTVEGGEVFVAQSKPKVSIIGVRLRGVQKDAVVLDQPGFLLRIPDRLYVRFQVLHERVEMPGQYLDQSDARNAALRILVLRDCGGYRHQEKAECCNCEPECLFHSLIFLREIESRQSVAHG